ALFATAQTTPQTTIYNGPKSWLSQYSIGNIPDGTSNTVSFAERLAVCQNSNNPTNSVSPVYSQRDHTPASYTNCMPVFNQPTAFGAVGTTPLATPQIGVSRTTCSNGMETSTSHTGAMVVGMTDGSVRSVGSGVSQPTWYYACNPADGMPLPSDW